MRVRLLLPLLAAATCLTLAALAPSRADTPPAAWTQDDMNACREYTYAHFLNLRGGKNAKTFDDVSLWWGSEANAKGAPLFDPHPSEILALFSEKELAGPAKLCLSAATGKTSVDLSKGTAMMLSRYAAAHPAPPPAAAPPPPAAPAETAPPAPKRIWTAAEIYPDPQPGTEDRMDCYVAYALAWGYASGDAAQTYLDAFLAVGSAPVTGEETFEARATPFHDRIGEAGITAMADRCLAGSGAAINPQREALMGPERYAQYLYNAAAATRAAEQARADAEAADALGNLYARCDAAAAAGLDRASRDMGEAQRMALNWAATGRYGTNYAVDPFKRGCGNVKDTWATLNNMQCPDEFFSEVQSFFDQYVLDLGTGALYCEQ
ncbi:hypothetical protein [Hyphomonas sp.]|uniref:hypothetical protein n=1 Tax=Hyphomonas sp. TaxID=87 RepID=UPI00391B33C1